jgi:hypothetical protein
MDLYKAAKQRTASNPLLEATQVRHLLGFFFLSFTDFLSILTKETIQTIINLSQEISDTKPTTINLGITDGFRGVCTRFAIGTKPPSLYYTEKISLNNSKPVANTFLSFSRVLAQAHFLFFFFFLVSVQFSDFI